MSYSRNSLAYRLKNYDEFSSNFDTHQNSDELFCTEFTSASYAGSGDSLWGSRICIISFFVSGGDKRGGGRLQNITNHKEWPLVIPLGICKAISCGFVMFC
jgi:hypothetical protein